MQKGSDGQVPTPVPHAQNQLPLSPLGADIIRHPLGSGSLERFGLALSNIRVPYALHRLPRAQIGGVLAVSEPPKVGDLALARVIYVGRTARVELETGRRSALRPDDLLGVVFGNRYATGQYEAYVGMDDSHRCDLLTMAGVCGIVKSKQQSTADPTRLAIVGYLSNTSGDKLRLQDFALKAVPGDFPAIQKIVVCGSSMDSGKTTTAAAVIRGLVEAGRRVGAVKLTGTAAGADLWKYLDAGAFRAYDFSDCGFPSTFGCTLDELLNLDRAMSFNLAGEGAEFIVIEIADGVLQQETAALLSCPSFTQTVDAFVYAATDPLSVLGGLSVLRDLSIKVVAISGKVSMSPLAVREVEHITQVRCFTVEQLCNAVRNGLVTPNSYKPTWASRNGHRDEAQVQRTTTSTGRVYEWQPDPESRWGGSIALVERELGHLDSGANGLRGRFVRVMNRGVINAPDPTAGRPVPTPIGDAQPDSQGNYIFEPGHGGGRIDKVELATEGVRRRYVQAAHFGEVNTYFHLDRIASYVNGLLQDLGVTPLPPVTAVVYAHNGILERDGSPDGDYREGRWVPFQGGHYRLPARRYTGPRELYPIEPSGEIHLGPGRHLQQHGALAELIGRPYRSNAAHNAGTLYHEYGHHIVRYTADFQANRYRPAEHQRNRKTCLDEGSCDYWAAAMLESPDIWAWYHGDRSDAMHPRSLTSLTTIADLDPRPQADPHRNGTIWAAALWDMRLHIASADSGGARTADLLFLQALLLLGVEPAAALREDVPANPEMFAVGLRALLGADEIRSAGRHGSAIRSAFARRGVSPGKTKDHI